jgi:hypothetical protein
MKRLLQFLSGVLLLAGAMHVQAAALAVFAGGGTKITGFTTDCRLADPFATDFDSAGNTYICEMTNNRVVKVDSRGMLTVFAGTTKKGSAGDGGPAAVAEFNGPHHLVVAKNGDVFVADTWNRKIRRIDAQTAIVSTFAGTGTQGYKGDGGLAKEADFSGIYSLSFDAAQENLFLADLENRRVRAIDMKSGVVRLVAGTGQKGVPADGSDAAKSPLVDPRAVAVAKSGEMYILERSGHVLRVVDVKGKIHTVVGSGKAGGVTPTTNPLEATLNGPKHLWVDRDETVLIADTENHVIRRYLPKENKVLLVAGTGKRGLDFNPDPLKTSLRQPHGVNVDAKGRIYISDSSNGRVLRLTP